MAMAFGLFMSVLAGEMAWSVWAGILIKGKRKEETLDVIEGLECLSGEERPVLESGFCS